MKIGQSLRNQNKLQAAQRGDANESGLDRLNVDLNIYMNCFPQTIATSPMVHEFLSPEPDKSELDEQDPAKSAKYLDWFWYKIELCQIFKLR